MKVILLEDVKNLGQKGAVVDVSDGYARNFLLPRRLAVEASPGRMKDLAQQQAVAARKKKEAEARARELAERLEGLTIRISAKVGEGGKLFGAVGNKDVADALQQQYQIHVDRKKVVLKEPIKHLGEHSLVVKLHPQVNARIKVVVIPE